MVDGALLAIKKKPLRAGSRGGGATMNATESAGVLIRDYSTGELQAVKHVELDSLARSISNMRQEIGNPVNAVRTMLRLLHRKHRQMEGDKMDRYLTHSLQEMDRLAGLSQRLNWMSFIEELNAQPVQLGAFVEKTLKGVLSELDGSVADVRVEDNGHGLGAEGRERFFEPLWTTREGHDGMGFLVILTAVQAIGGSLEIIDKEQDGLIRILHLPGELHEF
jgi:nitrogen-specific signal transduction histidine kinase